MIGELVGSYRVERKLGEGGMGVVYVAEHPLLRKKAVVKFLHADLSSNAELTDRFFNEARSATMIRHPGIVDVFDFGHHASGCAFILMEFLEGESLAGRLRQGPVDPARAILLGRQIASALGAAHVQGIVHRDLKPDNIFLVTDRDATGGVRCKVLDFGIAKLAGETAGSVKTQTGTVMGTPTYMAPEQCRSAGEVDHRADIYSLGCILFELVCGRPPFRTQSLGQLIAAHMFETPPAPSTFCEVPADLEAIILQALAKEAPDRQRSMGDLADQLAACAAASTAVSTEWTSRPMPRAGTEPSSTYAVGEAAVTRPPSTTLGKSSGELAHMVPVTVPPVPKSARWLGPALIGVAVAGGGIAYWKLGSASAEQPAPVAVTPVVDAAPAPPPPPPKPVVVEPPAPRHVTLSLDSTPRGADILQDLDGIRIGRTPYQRSLVPIANGSVTYVVRLAGYEDVRVDLATDRDESRTLALVPIKKSRPRPPSTQPPKPPVDTPPPPPTSDGMLRPK